MAFPMKKKEIPDNCPFHLSIESQI
jgi:hypothetical protein